MFDTLTQVDFHEWDGAGWHYQGKLAYTYDDTNTLIRRQQYDQYDVLQDDVKYLVDTQNLTGYSQVLAEIDGETGQLRRLNTYTDEIKAEQVSNSSAYSYLRTDALGSIRSLTGADASGSPLAESFNYTAFGSPFAGDDGNRSLTNYAFTGQVRDAASELQYHRARWLNTGVGQWTSPDAVFDFPGGLGSDHGYCTANPINGFDLSGNQFSLSSSLVVAANIASLASFGAQGVLWVLEKAGAVALVNNAYVEGLKKVLIAIDIATAAFSIPGAFRSIARFLAKPGGWKALASIGNAFGRAGSFFRIGIRGAVTGVTTAKALVQINGLSKLPKELRRVAVIVYTLTQQARDLIVLKKWDVLRQQYGHLDNVNELLRAVEAKSWGTFFTASGKAIHSIVEYNLRVLMTEYPLLCRSIRSIERASEATGGCPDIRLVGDFVLDITTSKEAPKAVGTYGAKAVDIIYESFTREEVRNIFY